MRDRSKEMAEKCIFSVSLHSLGKLCRSVFFFLLFFFSFWFSSEVEFLFFGQCCSELCWTSLFWYLLPKRLTGCFCTGSSSLWANYSLYTCTCACTFLPGPVLWQLFLLNLNFVFSKHLKLLNACPLQWCLPLFKHNQSLYLGLTQIWNREDFKQRSHQFAGHKYQFYLWTVTILFANKCLNPILHSKLRFQVQPRTASL